jgi:hypothetical protein
VINWLNKQLTELNVNGTPTGNGLLNGGAPGQVMLQFKPFGALANSTAQQVTITPRNLPTSGSNNTSEQISQNCLSSNSSNSSSSASSSGGILRSNSATRNFNGNSNGISEFMLSEQQPRPYTVTTAMHHNGINTITTSANPAATTTRTLNATQQSNQSTRSLDPKYFQPTSPVDTLNTNALKSRLNTTTNGILQSNMHPTIMNQQQQPQSHHVFGQQQQAGTRISKQLVNQVPSFQTGQASAVTQNNFLPCKSTPALASAYFPN